MATQWAGVNLAHLTSAQEAPCFCFHKVHCFPFLHPHALSHMTESCALHRRSGSPGDSTLEVSQPFWDRRWSCPRSCRWRWLTTGVGSLPTGSSEGGLGEPQGMGQVGKKIQIPRCSALPLSLPSILGELPFATIEVSLKI